MDKAIAEAIIKRLEDEGLAVEDGEGFSLHEDYSGRFMFGAKTAAIVIDSVTDLIHIGWAAGVEGLDLDLDDIATDNMGMGLVVY